MLGTQIWWHESPIRINKFETYHVGLFRKVYNNCNKPCWKYISNDDISTSFTVNDLKNYLKIFHYYKIKNAEKKLLQYIKNNIEKDEYLNLFTSYICNYLYSDMYNEFENGNFELARYRAQQFINYAQVIPPSIFYEKNSYRLSKVREVCEYVHGVFPYSKNSTYDRRAYIELANSCFRGNNVNKELMWKNFASDFSDSIRADEAEFNLINYYLRNANSEEDNRNILEVIDVFLDKYRSSYLADDACWYGILVACRLGLNDLAFRYFDSIISEYPDSDHFKRLKYRMMRWLIDYHEFPQDVSKKFTDFIFSLPKHKNKKISTVISIYFYDEEAKKIISSSLKYFIDIYQSEDYNNAESYISFDGEVKDIVPVIIKFWYSES